MSELQREKIERILCDLRNEPAWRTEANREWDLYDGNQLGQDTLARMRELGIPPIQINMIGPAIDGVVGMEARTRTDPLVRAETDEHTDVADALNVKLKEATRLSRYNRACADAFGSATKVGVGWIEVARESDPFKYPYRVQDVHRSEIWWDFRDRTPDLSRARFLVRARWYDADELENVFPGHKRTLRQSLAEHPLWDMQEGYDADLARSWEIEQAATLESTEWRDADRRRLRLYEVWYRVSTQVWVLDLPDGRVVEVNRKDRRHLEVILAGALKPRQVRTDKMRVAYYVGPHRLTDRPSPYRHGRFPYVPIFAKREDKSGAPYGLIRAMRSPQEEVNARRSKMLYNLSTRRVIADQDAVLDHRRTAQEVARSDAYIILNPNRRNAGGFNVDTDARLNDQQYQVMLEAKQNIQDASGLFHEMIGRGAGAGQSGEAIKSLVEQGQQVLGELMDNYRDARRIAAEMLLSMITEDLEGKDDVCVRVESATGAKRDVMLNHPEMDPQCGLETRANDVIRAKVRVALDETPSSTTYRQQVLSRMLELTQSLPPEIQVAVLDIIVAATDLPNRQEMVDRIRQVTGMGGDQEPRTEEEAMAMQQQAQAEQEAAAQQQAIEQQAIELEMREREAKIMDLEARAQKAMADAQRAQAEVQRILVLAQKAAGVDSDYVDARTRHELSRIGQERNEDIRRTAAHRADMIGRTQQQQTNPPDPRQGSQQAPG